MVGRVTPSQIASASAAERQNLAAPQLSTHNHIAECVYPMSLKDRQSP
jgi:hypothetical protein